MKNDKLAMLFRASDSEVDLLIPTLKTLEVHPPTIEYRIVVMCPESSFKTQEMFEDVALVEVFPYSGSYGEALRVFWEQSTEEFLTWSHPDVLFVKSNWCDQVFSTIIQNDLGVLGAQPFKRYEVDEGYIDTVNDYFMAAKRSALKKIVPFEPSLNLYGHDFLTQLRLKKNNIQVMGGVIWYFIAHLESCLSDSYVPKDAEIEFLNRIYEKENLGSTL